ncbi:DNA-directed RNA polymerase subunit omega [bacterium]|nr:DNA-directed RNA polymerase subunit omega [bacterium]
MSTEEKSDIQLSEIKLELDPRFDPTWDDMLASYSLSTDSMLKKSHDRYTLVMDAARRAPEINAVRQRYSTPRSVKVTNVSLNEISQERLIEPRSAADMSRELNDDALEAE